MLDDDVERRLAALGTRNPPGPRARFVDELGERLVYGSPAPSRPIAVSRIQVSRFLSPILSAAAAVLVTVLVMSGRGDDGETVQMFQAAGSVEVVLPDGRVVPGVAGMTVPEGSLIRVRGAGHAEVGGVIVGPGESAEVVSGVVQPTGVPAPTTTTTAAPATTTTTTPRPTPTTAAPARPATAVPAETTTTSTTEPPSTTTTQRQVQQMRLTAQYNDRGQVALRWSGYFGPDFGRYVVLRAPYPNRPDRPGENGTQIVFQTPDQQHVFRVDAPEPGTDPVYRVIALDPSNRRIVATTFAVRPQPAPTGTRPQSAPTATQSQPVTTTTQPPAAQPVPIQAPATEPQREPIVTR